MAEFVARPREEPEKTPAAIFGENLGGGDSTLAEFGDLNANSVRGSRNATNASASRAVLLEAGGNEIRRDSEVLPVGQDEKRA